MRIGVISTVAESGHLDLMHPPQQLYLDPRIGKVVGLMRRNLHLRLSLSRLAGAISLSPSRFSHLFKSETGVAPAQYLKFIRLRQVRGLLESTNLSVKEVAGRVGLGVSRLIREYRNTYGATPAQYRRLMLLHAGQRAECAVEPRRFGHGVRCERGRSAALPDCEVSSGLGLSHHIPVSPDRQTSLAFILFSLEAVIRHLTRRRHICRVVRRAPSFQKLGV